MGLPTLENGPYIFSVNNKFTEGNATDLARRIMLEIKNTLVNLGGAGVNWQVVASSDSVSVINIEDLDEDHDLWIDISDIIWGSGNHSWCVLEHQVTGAQLVLDAGNTGSFYYFIVKFSRLGTFSISDGTLSSRPTSTDDLSLWADSYNFHPNSASCLATVIHVMESADHLCTRIIVNYKLSTTGAVGSQVILIEQATDTIPAWISADKTVGLSNKFHSSLSLTPDGQTPKLEDVETNYWYARLVTAEPYDAWVACYPLAYCYGPFTGATATPICKLTGYPWLGDFVVSPIGLYNDAAEQGGVYGRIRDLYFAPHTHLTYTTYPNDDTKAWIKFGCFLFPWNGTQPVQPY